MNTTALTLRTDRLVDYFCVMGPGATLTLAELPDESGYNTATNNTDNSGSLPHPLQSLFHPILLDRYPVEEDRDSPFPAGLPLLAFPACVQLKRATPSAHPLPTFFTLVATNSDKEHVYGHVLVFWEGITASQAACVDMSAIPDDGTVLFAPKCLCIVSKWAFPGFRVVLAEMFRLSLSHISLPLERIIANFASEVPVPPAGRITVLYQTLSGVTVEFKRPPKNRRVSADMLPFRDVFECLDLTNVVTLMRCVLTEKKILFVSSQLSLLTAAAEVFVSLIYPFRWQNIYIPVLPRVGLQTLQAPMAFILGLHRSDYEAVYDTIPEDVIVVLLDKNTIIADPTMTVPHIPAHQKAKLFASLERVADAFSRRGASWHLTRLPAMDTALHFGPPPESFAEGGGGEGEGEGEDGDAYANSDDDERRIGGKDHNLFKSGKPAPLTGCNWHATRRAFFRLFVSLFLRYRDFLVYPSAENGGRAHFDTEGFLKTCKPDAVPLLTAVLQTQSWNEFIDERFVPGGSSMVDVEFFDQSIDEKKNRSIYSLFSKKETPFLTTKEFLHERTVGAAKPDESDLPDYPNKLYHYCPFPPLNRALYPKSVVQIETYADAVSRSRNNASTFRGGLLSIFGSRNTSSAIAPSGAAFAHIEANTTEQNVYTIWFLAFLASLDVITNDIDRRAGEEYDAAEEEALQAYAKDSCTQPAVPSTAPLDLGSQGKARFGSVAASLQATAPTAQMKHASRAPSFRDGSVAAQLSAQPVSSSSSSTVYDLPARLEAPTQPHGVGPGQSKPRFTSTSTLDTSILNDVKLLAHVDGTPSSPYFEPHPTDEKALKAWRQARIKKREAAISAARGMYRSRLLEVAFGILERMKCENIAPGELIYRCLLEACARLGNYGKSYQLLSEMQAAGIPTDASLYRTVYQAFWHSNPEAGASHPALRLPSNAFQFMQTKSNGPPSRAKPSSVAARAASTKSGAYVGMSSASHPSMGLGSFSRTFFAGTPSSDENTPSASSVPDKKATPSSDGDRRGSVIGKLDAATPPPSESPSGELPSNGIGHVTSRRSVAPLVVPSQAEVPPPAAAKPPTAARSSGLTMQRLFGASMFSPKPPEPSRPARADSMEQSSSPAASRHSPAPLSLSSSPSPLTNTAPFMPATPLGAVIPAEMASITVYATIFDRRRNKIQYLARQSEGIGKGPSGELGRTPSSAFGRPCGTSSFIAESDLLMPVARAGSNVVAVAAGVALARRFPGLSINTLREKCPDCGTDLTDEDIRQGWTSKHNDYTSYHVTCKAPSVSSAASSRGFRGEAVAPTGPTRFVPRFTITSLSPMWKGSMENGPTASLFCEYLPPAVLVHELYQSVVNDQFGPLLRLKSPRLFWNLVLWFLCFALPIECLTYLAREENIADEQKVLTACVHAINASKAPALPVQKAPVVPIVQRLTSPSPEVVDDGHCAALFDADAAQLTSRRPSRTQTSASFPAAFVSPVGSDARVAAAQAAKMVSAETAVEDTTHIVSPTGILETPATQGSPNFTTTSRATTPVPPHDDGIVHPHRLPAFTVDADNLLTESSATDGASVVAQPAEIVTEPAVHPESTTTTPVPDDPHTGIESDTAETDENISTVHDGTTTAEVDAHDDYVDSDDSGGGKYLIAYRKQKMTAASEERNTDT